jgi:hypothetical protein
MLGCYWFSGVVFTGDGSDHKGRMGEGAPRLGDPDVEQCIGVGREEAHDKRHDSCVSL